MHKSLKVSNAKFQFLTGGEIIGYLHFSESLVPEWCLLLSMLNIALIDSINLKNPSGIVVAQVSVTRLPIESKDKRQFDNINHRGVVSSQNNVYQIILTAEELTFWLAFFLMYIRDGMTPVNHIDFDVHFELDGQDTPFFLELSVEEPIIPISEEARKILNTNEKK
jgi:hypothetical protein